MCRGKLLLRFQGILISVNSINNRNLPRDFNSCILFKVVVVCDWFIDLDISFETFFIIYVDM